MTNTIGRPRLRPFYFLGTVRRAGDSPPDILFIDVRAATADDAMTTALRDFRRLTGLPAQQARIVGTRFASREPVPELGEHRGARSHVPGRYEIDELTFRRVFNGTAKQDAVLTVPTTAGHEPGDVLLVLERGTNRRMLVEVAAVRPHDIGSVDLALVEHFYEP